MTAREVGIRVCATAVKRLKAVTLRRAASRSAGQCRGAIASGRAVARASSNSSAPPMLSPIARMLQIGISLRASLTAGQLNPHDSAMAMGQALAPAEPRRAWGWSEGEVTIVLCECKPTGWGRHPQGAQQRSEGLPSGSRQGVASHARLDLAGNRRAGQERMPRGRRGKRALVLLPLLLAGVVGANA